MLVDNLLEALDKGGHTHSRGLLEEIKSESKTLEHELRRFFALCGGLKIGSFYERNLTQGVVVVCVFTMSQDT
jgi:hypothetical protein